MNTPAEKRVGELESIIASAIALIESGERGSALKMLKTGKVKPTTSSTGVIAKDGAA